MKDSITISKCDKENCSEVAPTYCDNCGNTLCMEHAEKHDCESEQILDEEEVLDE